MKKSSHFYITQLLNYEHSTVSAWIVIQNRWITLLVMQNSCKGLRKIFSLVSIRILYFSSGSGEEKKSEGNTLKQMWRICLTTQNFCLGFSFGETLDWLIFIAWAYTRYTNKYTKPQTNTQCVCQHWDLNRTSLKQFA